MKSIVFLTMLCGLALAAVAQAAGTNTTITLRQGVAGYTGAEDVWLNAIFANRHKNYGNFNTILMHSSAVSNPATISHTGAVKFDLSSIPVPDDVSTTVTAKLYLFTSENGWATTFNVNLHKVLLPLVFGTGTGAGTGWGESTYSRRFLSSPGTSPNNLGWGAPPPGDDTVMLGPVPTEDFSWTPDASAPRGLAVQETLEFDVSALVNFWLANPGQNYGVYVLPEFVGQANSNTIFTSEAAEAVRPMLEITIVSDKKAFLFRQGVNGYLGAEDLWLSNTASQIHQNFGARTDMYTEANSDPGIDLVFDTAAVKFDLSGFTLTPAQTVTGAKLYLYAYSHNGLTSTFSMGLHKVINPFGYGIWDGASTGDGGFGWGFATYSYNSFNNQKWGNPGATALAGPVPTEDFSWAPDATVVRTVDEVQVLEFDATDLVDFWLANPSQNNGVFIFPDPNGTHRTLMYTSDHATEEFRPRLEITILEGAPTLCSEVWNFGFGLGGDVTQDCSVDEVDVATLSDQFLDCSDPATLNSGCSVATNSHKILKIPGGGITVDGNGSEWPADSEWLPLDTKYFASPSGPLPFDISSARFTLRWDDATDKIYALVEVRDANQLFLDSPSGFDDSDRIEVYSQGDAAGGTGWGASSTNKWYDVAQQYFVGPKTIATGGGWAFLQFAGSPPPPAIPASAEFESSVTVSGDLITYELGVKMFDHYGGISGDPNVVTQLAAGKIVGFDIIADTKYTHQFAGAGAFGMRSENGTSADNKATDAANFQKYELVNGPLVCGDVGYFSADVTKNCVVDLVDFAQISSDFMKCNDPTNMPPCIATWP